jgi:hypothetical protein
LTAVPNPYQPGSIRRHCDQLKTQGILSRAEELLKVTAVCPTVCNLSCEREDVTLDPNKVTCRACRERAKARSEQERTAR